MSLELVLHFAKEQHLPNSSHEPQSPPSPPPQDTQLSLNLPNQALEFDKLNQLQIEWEGLSTTKFEGVLRACKPEIGGKPLRKKSVKKWTKLKNGLFGWRVVRESRLEKGESSSHKTTHANVLDFRWQPKLQLVDKGVNEMKLGNTIQKKRKQNFSSNYEHCEENKNLGNYSDIDTDLEVIRKRKYPVGI